MDARATLPMRSASGSSMAQKRGEGNRASCPDTGPGGTQVPRVHFHGLQPGGAAASARETVLDVRPPVLGRQESPGCTSTAKGLEVQRPALGQIALVVR